MTLRPIFICAFLAGTGALVAACAGGEDDGSAASGSPSGSPSSTSSASVGAGGSGGAGGSEGPGGGQQTGAGGSGGGIGVGGGPAADGLVPKLKSMDMYANCMPAIPPDPVNGQFLVDYDTTAAMGPSSATITSAKLIFDSSNSFTFSVTPDGSGTLASGAVIQMAHVKKNNSGSGTKGPCGFCNGTWSLEVTFDVNGKSVVTNLPAEPVNCVF